MVDTIVREILEKKLAREVLTFADDFRDDRVFDGECLFLAAFAAKPQIDAFAIHARMPVTQCCQSVGTVLLNIFLIANAHATDVEESDYGREDFVFR